jgi:hypothetical protein
MKGSEWPQKYRVGPGGLGCVCCTKFPATIHRRKANRASRRKMRQTVRKEHPTP